MRWAGYIWSVLLGAFNLFVVSLVLISIREPDHQVIVAALGIIYTHVRLFAGGYGLLYDKRGLFLSGFREELKAAADPNYQRPHADHLAAHDEWAYRERRFYIDAAFLWAVQIACLIRIVSTLL